MLIAFPVGLLVTAVIFDVSATSAGGLKEDVVSV
jgi:uncharacterized membrane protein